MAGGSTLSEVAEKIREEIGLAPICALVNNKTEHLGYAVYSPKQVEFIDACHPAGRHVYVRSLCMMLYRSLTVVAPGCRLRFEHSVGLGYFCRVYDKDKAEMDVDEQFCESLAAEMRRLTSGRYPFERCEQLTQDVKEIFRSQGLDDKVLLLDTLDEIYTTYYRLDGVADSYYGPLAPHTAMIDVYDLKPYHGGILLLGPDDKIPSQAAGALEQKKMFEAFTEHLRFNSIVGVASVGELNRAVQHHATSDLINVAEALHGKMIGRIADEVADRRRQGGASIVLMAGPSSSGKTTTSKRLAIQLMTNLITPKLISLDDYFVDRHLTPRDESGDYDFESIYALDLELFNSDIRRLLKGEEINLPTYSFELGRRVERHRPLRLEANDVLIVEGIHGLNPELTPAISPDDIFKVYVSALTTLRIDDHNWISTSDTRLLRRIVRDNKYRHTLPQETIRRWPSVRAGEEKWIFPFQENADATFNSSLLFELAVMKNYALPLLEQVPHTAAEYTQAYRLMRFLRSFRPVTAEDVPSTSLLREFLGGSSFHY